MMISMRAIVLSAAVQALRGLRSSRGHAPQELGKPGAQESISSTISCDWDGDRRMSGKSSQDDYYWTCSSGRLTRIGAADTSLVAIEQEDVEAAATGSLACDWTGDRKFRGANSCGDFLFGCYLGKLYYVMMVGDLDKTSSCTGYGCPAPAHGSAVGCNFNRPMRASGANSNDDFYFVCNNEGQLTAVRNADTFALVEAEEASNETAQESASSGECITWGTAEGSWQLVGYGNTEFSRTVTYGTESSDTSSLSQQWGASLTVSVASGVAFAKKSVSVGLSYSIARETSSTYTQSNTVTVNRTCPYGGMYQWVMKNGRPWQSSSQYGTSVYTDISWCTLDADRAPQCPPFSCDCDGIDNWECNCQKCKSWQGGHNDVSYAPPACDWTGSRKLTGQSSNDDYYLRCDEGKLSSITSATALAATNVQGCSGCDWSGVRHFAGARSNDNLYLHCCGTSGNLLGIHATDGFTPLTPGSYNSGIPCQWSGTRRAYGVHSNDDFDFTCVGSGWGGLLTRVDAIPDR